jgi:hypothetical protein
MVGAGINQGVAVSKVIMILYFNISAKCMNVDKGAEPLPASPAK